MPQWGAAHITIPTTAKIILPPASMRSTSAAARSPKVIKAKPHATEINSTCRTLPSAKAPKKLFGMIFIRKGTKPTAAVCLT